jgi:hypothetical protein
LGPWERALLAKSAVERKERVEDTETMVRRSST